MVTATRIRDKVEERGDGIGDVGGIPRRPFGRGDDGLDGIQDSRRRARNARLGMAMFLGAEGVFFAGLIAAFMYLRLNALQWPPPSQPRLPVFVTGINTVLLLASAFTLRGAQQAARWKQWRRAGRGLELTILLGSVFLLVQGYEWARLIGFGLTFSSGSYGATFYTLIGLHGLHVLGAVIWLAAASVLAGKNGFVVVADPGLFPCAMYWHFVVALWPVLYGLVYLL